LPTFTFLKSDESQGLGGFLRPGVTAKDISKVKVGKGLADIAPDPILCYLDR